MPRWRELHVVEPYVVLEALDHVPLLAVGMAIAAPRDDRERHRDALNGAEVGVDLGSDHAALALAQPLDAMSRGVHPDFEGPPALRNDVDDVEALSVGCLAAHVVDP